MCSRIAVLLSAILVVAFSIAAVAQDRAMTPASPAPQAAKSEVHHVPATYTNPSSGIEMYRAYCASCHGVGGEGNGPAASALKTPPTDLAQLAAKNGGTFPADHIAQIIRGDVLTAAHGSKEMPVWGPVFLRMGEHDPAQVQLRIRNLTKYLESIQQK